MMFCLFRPDLWVDKSNHIFEKKEEVTLSGHMDLVYSCEKMLNFKFLVAFLDKMSYNCNILKIIENNRH